MMKRGPLSITMSKTGGKSRWLQEQVDSGKFDMDKAITITNYSELVEKARTVGFTGTIVIRDEAHYLKEK